MMPRPSVLCFSGHDPSGGAGIQADIEAISHFGCHASSVITALTQQNTHNVTRLVCQNPEDIINQAKTLLSDLPIAAIKIGLLGSTEIARAVLDILQSQPNIPVILDPVLASGGGKDLSDINLIRTIVDLFLPSTTILTPNSDEARRLTGLKDLTDCGISLLQKGCDFVLITGTHEATHQVSNQLFHDGQLFKTLSWDRLPHSYHGSGCTLAASIAALVAKGQNVIDAVILAQEYTWNTLKSGYQPGTGQHVPNRSYCLNGT